MRGNVSIPLYKLSFVVRQCSASYAVLALSDVYARQCVPCILSLSWPVLRCIWFIVFSQCRTMAAPCIASYGIWRAARLLPLPRLIYIVCNWIGCNLIWRDLIGRNLNPRTLAYLKTPGCVYNSDPLSTPGCVYEIYHDLAIQAVIKSACLARSALRTLCSGLFYRNSGIFWALKYRVIHIMRDYSDPVRVRHTGVRRGNTPRLQGAG